MYTYPDQHDIKMMEVLKETLCSTIRQEKGKVMAQDLFLMLLFGCLVTVPITVDGARVKCRDQMSTDLCVRMVLACATHAHIQKYCQRTCKLCPSPASPALEPPAPSAPQPAVPSIRMAPTGVCGKRSTARGTRIVGGSTAARGSWAWQILLKKNGRGVCGGAIIAPHWVLTAAHCVKELNGPTYSVVAGEHDTRVHEGSETKHGVDKVYAHPQYSGNDNDIALLKIKSPISFDKYVQPVCLPSERVATGTRCYVTGWGKKRSDGEMSAVLRQAMLPVVDTRICDRKNSASLGITVSDAMLCGGDAGMTHNNGCHGDSGSAYVCHVTGSWQVHGVVSHGDGDCDSGKAYTVFARVAHFKGWIDSITKNN